MSIQTRSRRPVSAILFAALAAPSLLPAQAPTAPAPDAQPAQQPIEPPAAIEQIDAKELLAHATFLASDELGGRLTGSPGQLAAARYIAEHFEKLGLAPLGDEVEGKRTYFQAYQIRSTGIREGSALQVGEVELKDHYAVLGGKPMQLEVEGPVKFYGLGRTRGASADVGAEEDLAQVVPIVVLRPPRGQVDRNLPVEQKFMMSFRSFQSVGTTSRALARRGAKVVLFAMVEDPLGFADVLNYLAISPGKDLIQPRFEGVMDGMAGMAGMIGGSSDAASIVLDPHASAQLFEQLGIDRAAVGAFLAGDREEMPEATKEPKGKIALEIGSEDGTAVNVAAVLRGRDEELADEAVVYSAHMDHVGRRLDGEIFNGADDNASGSAGLLGIAKAFAKAEERPRRSVVFLSVSGEELGLWGSAYYAANPTFEGTIVANVNTDMIGRSGPESGPDQVTVTPSHDHRMFSTIVQDSARFGEQLGLTFTSGDKYYERSDHYNFAKLGIPVVFFCNGEHEDYHQVTDHADKLDGTKMERIARLAFWTGWAVANADDRPRTLGMRADWK